MSDQIPYELLARYFAGECNRNETKQVEEWRRENSANEKVFDEFKAIWSNTGTARDNYSPPIDSGLRKVNQRIEAAEKSVGNQRQKKNLGFYVIRIAAILIISLAVWYGYDRIAKPGTNYTEFRTHNVKNEVKLPDGTIVTLNKSSKISYPEKFTKGKRIVYLEGEAFFDVARNPEKPFIIYAQQSETKVLGTSFNLKADKADNEVIITVAEGHVEFSSDKDNNRRKVELSAGEKGILLKSTTSVKKEKNTDQNFMAWKTGELTFQKTPLSEAVKDISGYFNIPVRIADQKLDTLPVTLGIPLDIPVEDALEALEYISGTNISYEDSIYVIKPASVK